MDPARLGDLRAVCDTLHRRGVPNYFGRQRFGLRGDTIVLIGQRTTRDLDRSEIYHLIETVSNDADRFDDELVKEFGGRRGD